MSAYHPVDVHVGARLKAQRKAREMSQTDLGDAAGITFQQCQKYEKGSNRISASRLWEFAKILDVEVGFFFDGLPRSIQRRNPAGLPKSARGRRPT